jgi:hypothetical protein
VVILWPGTPRLKEWASRGKTFDLTAAAWSQAATGHPLWELLAPLVLLG